MVSACTLKNNIVKKIPISSITPFTFQDYPDHTACILWFSGCNFLCQYCHNPELVKGMLPKLPFEQVWDFLCSRRGLLEGVVFSGGECTLSPSVFDLWVEIKKMGFLIKVDTNGSSPDLLQKGFERHLIDYVALDYKAPREKFELITQSGYADFFWRSLAMLSKAKIPFEIRTTVHPDLIDEDDVNIILADLSMHQFKGKYFLQNFKSGITLGNLPEPTRTFNLKALKMPTDFEVGFRNF